MSALRPSLTYFEAYKLSEHFSIRASISLERFKKKNIISSPMHDLDLLKGDVFHLKVLSFKKDATFLSERIFESDGWGQFRFMIPYDQNHKIHYFKLYEVHSHKALEFYLGTFSPVSFPEDKKIVISDFDKTLIDNKHSTAKDLLHSLTSPLNSYRTIDASVSYLKNYIGQGFFPVLLSASPHFYARAINQWLKDQDLTISCILLKNYLKTLSFFEYFHPHNHAAFKLNEILELFLLTEFPNELVLLGDSSQTDPLVYSTIEKILKENPDPLELLRGLTSQHRSFQTVETRARTLKNLFKVKKILDQRPNINRKISIYIRNAK